MNHWGILLSNQIDKKKFIDLILSQKATKNLTPFNQLSGVLFSDIAIQQFVEQEYKYDRIQLDDHRKLRTFSSGERKKLFLQYCQKQQPDYIILDNPFDHLDSKSRTALAIHLEEIAKETILIQLANRAKDILFFISNQGQLNDNSFNLSEISSPNIPHQDEIPLDIPLSSTSHEDGILVKFNQVSVNYENIPIVKDISWTIKQHEFWQLIGPNGSGKSTLISLITGDNVKAYGQEIYLFGRKKGTGESVWSIKKQLGYFSTNLTELFNSNQTVENMVLSGFYDSIGLYNKPTDLQKQLVYQWLAIIDLQHLKNTSFKKLTIGQQRAILILRAVIKQPPLLLLDEPIEGLDDENVALVIQLINTFIEKTTMTIVFVSHRIEPTLSPTSIFELIPNKMGSIGKVKLI